MRVEGEGDMAVLYLSCVFKVFILVGAAMEIFHRSRLFVAYVIMTRDAVPYTVCLCES